MNSRASIWRKFLLSEGDGVLKKRKMYHNIVTKFPYQCSDTIIKEIKRDIPRTSFKNTISSTKQKIIETLLRQYVQIMPCDGYLQGFNYIMALLYDVYSKDDVEHALADTWWSMVSVVSIVRPMIPDHDPNDFMRYTGKWSKHYKNHLQHKCNRLHTFLKPHYNMLLPTITAKWLLIWFTQVFPLEDIKIIWDALITCESRCRTKLMAIIAANITIQHSNHIETIARQTPSEIIGRIIDIQAKDAEVIIKNSRLAMVEYKIPGV